MAKDKHQLNFYLSKSQMNLNLTSSQYIDNTILLEFSEML